jgi:hypothetical protein
VFPFEAGFHRAAAEDGAVPGVYEGLTETESADYTMRTERNVRDSDATLILTIGEPTGGTEVTRRLAVAYGRPLLVLDLVLLTVPVAIALAAEWCAGLPRPLKLNVAGPRASKAPDIYPLARAVVAGLLEREST